MNQEAQDILDRVVKKDIVELTPFDIAFLRARRMYLTAEDKEKFKDVLKGKNKKESEPQTNQKTYKELQKEAKELGLPYKGASFDELEVAISTVKGPAR